MVSERKVLATVTLPADLGVQPDLVAAARHLGVAVSAFDATFGLVPLSTQGGTFAARISETAIGKPGIGPQASDPPITSFKK